MRTGQMANLQEFGKKSCTAKLGNLGHRKSVQLQELV